MDESQNICDVELIYIADKFQDCLQQSKNLCTQKSMNTKEEKSMYTSKGI